MLCKHANVASDAGDVELIANKLCVLPADASAQTRCWVEDSLAAAGSTNQRVETGRM